MASEPVINIEDLLSPIPGDNPCGVEYSTSDPAFIKIKDTFQRALTAERKHIELGSLGDDVEEADWDTVVGLACDILQNQSKDFRVAAWLIAALLRTANTPGIRDGFKVALGICEAYWENIRPMATEDDGHELTVAQFDGVVGEASRYAIWKIPLTDTKEEKFGYADYKSGCDLDAIKEATQRENKIASGAISLERFRDAVRKTKPEFYGNLVDDLEAAIDLLQKISEFLDANCKPNGYGESTAPSTVAFRKELEDVLRVVNAEGRVHLEALARKVDETANSGNAGAGGSGSSEGGSSTPLARMSAGSVSSRDDALEALRKIADFFEHTEPHSPLSHSLRRVIRWGGMSFPELLKEWLGEEQYQVHNDLVKFIGFEVSKPEDGH
jgi:type VI secretion system protein ImpA